MDYILQSKMKLFPIDVFYNEYFFGNIISLFDLIKVKDIVITFDIREGSGFNVTYGDKLYYFAPFDTGLYYFDTSKALQTVSSKTKSSVSPYSLLQSVEDNKKFYSMAEIKGADNARKQQEEIGWPSDVFYHNIIKENLLINTEITLDDVQRARHIYGPAKPILQGTMVRQRPTSNKIEKYNFHYQYQSITATLALVLISSLSTGLPFLQVNQQRLLS